MKKRKKLSVSFILAMICFVIAIGLALAGPIRTAVLSYKQKNSVAQLEELTVERIKTEDAKEAVYDFSSVEAINLRDVLNANIDASRYTPVGIIAIPDLNIKLPIYKGITNEILLLGAGTMKPNQQMGEGNYALAGHNYLDPKKNILFTQLQFMETGQKIYITDLEYVYIYEVSSIDIVSPSHVEVIEDREGITEITLVSCTNDAVNRYVDKGTFIQKISVDQAPDEVREAFNMELTKNMQ